MAERMTLGVDLGGSSSKATLLDANGKVLCSTVQEYPSYSPKPGWLEQDADELYEAVLENIRQCVSMSGADSGDIVAVCIDA
ncbi:MAG: xylulokinase, partial [Oscillospiraceae bacterium]|nr:xylulokinase [Oscillospiraceae bacterium]